MNRPALVVIALCAAALPALAYNVAGMRDAMRSVFDSMRVLLEMSQSIETLADPANERAILGAAGELADQASIVSEHAPRDEVSFLAGSLDRYANWIRRSYEWRRYDVTQRLVREAVDVCIACHTRLPSRRDSPLAEDFLAEATIGALPAARRAQLQIATRRFDDAMNTLESLLAGLPDGEAFDDAVRSYLVVALRVKGDPRRARQALAQLAASERISDARRHTLRDWAGALQRLEISPPVVGDLEAARMLVGEAEAKRNAGRGNPLVEYIAASRLLYEYLEDGTTGSVADGAEAYYLLGLAQYRTERSPWLPQAELYLEKAIRTAPSSESARRAYALLRAKVEQSFSAQGIAIPEEVVRHMQMLREMVESGKA